jgi:hypothetical protein
LSAILRLLAAIVAAAVSGCSTTGQRLPALPSQLLASSAFSRRPIADQWQQWAKENVQSGDILFIQGESHILLGLVNFSQVCMQLTDSRFSHVAVAAREGSELVVYDIIRDGARRTPWGDFVGDRRVHTLAVKRLRPEYRDRIPAALAYCRQVYESGVPFDQSFQLGNDRLYCSELIEIAFRKAGLPLSATVRIDQLPGYAKLRAPTKQLLETATPLRSSQEVLIPGNDTQGIWASPCLELVLDATKIANPPRARTLAARDD